MYLRMSQLEGISYRYSEQILQGEQIKFERLFWLHEQVWNFILKTQILRLFKNEYRQKRSHWSLYLCGYPCPNFFNHSLPLEMKTSKTSYLTWYDVPAVQSDWFRSRFKSTNHKIYCSPSHITHYTLHITHMLLLNCEERLIDAQPIAFDYGIHKLNVFLFSFFTFDRGSDIGATAWNSSVSSV